MLKLRFLILVPAICLVLYSCKQSGNAPEAAVNKTSYEFAFQNPVLPLEERVRDLVGRMSLQEKIAQMNYDAPAIERLSVPAYNWWNESLHGVARAGKATVFPQAIGLGATFDEDLILRVSTAISDEARAKYQAAIAKDIRVRYGGLTFWTPNVNIFRDPRWGRGQETYGEDPYLTSRLGSAFVRGLQGDHPRYLKTAACAKHYVVHSGPEKDRHVFNAVASPKDMYETYLPAFRSLVESGVEAVMCAYNRTNGEPCCGSPVLLQDILRGEFGFKGHIVSDCWALIDFHDGHKVTSGPVESAALALKSGVNLNCGDTYPFLEQAVEQGLVSESMIDSSLTVLLRTRFRLGMFDPDEMNPYAKIGPEVINSVEHRELAREAAVKSLVLLKNDNKTLPLSKDIPYLFVTGPNASTTEVLLGNYYGLSGKMTTILEGITDKVNPGSLIQYKQGFLLDRPNVNPIDWTTGDAQQADAIIAVVGISGLLEGEEGESIASETKGDRFDMNLPQNQIDFLKGLRKGYDKKLIVVITGGSPMDLTEVHELADAIIFAWYPGEQGGDAVADVLFGDANPSGRLPITFPKSLAQLPDYSNYNMEGRTYKYMNEEPQYPFGYGLNFSRFAYSNPKLSKNSVSASDSLEVKVIVSNQGQFAGSEVVQLYLSDLQASFRVPKESLRGIRRIELNPGESQEVSFWVTPEMMGQVNMEGRTVIEPGRFRLTIGGCSPGSRGEALGMPAPALVEFDVI